MAQSHGGGLWPEPAQGGATPYTQPVAWRYDGTNYTLSLTAPEQAAFVDLLSNGNYTLTTAIAEPRLDAVYVRGNYTFY